MKTKIANWIYRHLGTEWCGGTHPPGDRLRMEFGYEDRGKPIYIATTSDDGYSLCVGFRDEWLLHLSVREARQLAWFILWTVWIKGTWCGLKRKLWYWALSVKTVSWRIHS